MRKHWLGALISGSTLLLGTVALGGCGSSTSETKEPASTTVQWPSAYQAAFKSIEDGPNEFRYQLYSDGEGHLRFDRCDPHQIDLRLVDTHTYDLKTNQEVYWDLEHHTRTEQALDPDKLNWFYTQKHKDNLLAVGWKQIGKGPVNERPSEGFRDETPDANPNEIWVDSDPSFSFPTKTVSSRRDRSGDMDLFFFSAQALDPSTFVTTMDPVMIQLTTPPKPKEETTTGATTGTPTGTETGTETGTSTGTETSTSTSTSTSSETSTQTSGEKKPEEEPKSEETKQGTKEEAKPSTEESKEPTKEEPSKKPAEKSSK